MPVYEQLLDKDSRWALSEGSRHFEQRSSVFEALRKITQRLNHLHIPYAVIGGMALFKHGLRRFTEDVDILVTKEGLKTIHKELEGLGYLPPHQHSKHLRDTELGVRIEFLTTGEYPGDGRPKPVAFPDPASVSVESDGVHYINLPSLIELKLASGMTNPGRMKDLADVLELIKILKLPADFSQQLNSYVQDKYQELWVQGRTRYVASFRVRRLGAGGESLADTIANMRDAANRLEAMQGDGVVLEQDRGLLVTTDPEIAKKYDMVEESEFWGESADPPRGAAE